MKLGIITAAVLGVCLATAAQAAEIKMLSTGATKEAVLELLPDFEKSTGNKVVITWSGTADIKKRIAAGEVYDLVSLPAPEIEAFIKQGKFVAGSRVDLMKSGIGIAVRAGAPKPDIATSAAVKQALLAAKSIGYSSGPSGVYLDGLFQRMGVADQIKSKLKQTPSGVGVGTIIVSGEVELGFQQVSELQHFAGIDYVGPLPADIQEVTTFSSGIPTGSSQPEAAKALVKFLSAPSAAPVIKKHGLEPA